MAATYDLERARIAYAGCGCFWLQGGGLDVGLPIHQGLSVVGSFQGGYASNIRAGVGLGKISYLAGPRYTFESLRWRGSGGSRSRVQTFGEALFGGAHAFDGIFPATGGTAPTANSYAMQFGGGVDVGLGDGLGVRAFEVDYVRTALANNGTNTQNGFRVAFGLSYHFHRR